MRRTCWMILSSALLLAPLSLRAEDVLVPWAPAVIDSDEQAKAENRARLQAIESMHSQTEGSENSEEAWLRKFSPDVSLEDEEALAEEKTTAKADSKSAAKAGARTAAPSSRSGQVRETSPDAPGERKPRRSTTPAETTRPARNIGVH